MGHRIRFKPNPRRMGRSPIMATSPRLTGNLSVSGGGGGGGELVDNQRDIYTHWEQNIDSHDILIEDWSDPARGWTNNKDCDESLRGDFDTDYANLTGLYQADCHGWCMSIYRDPEHPWVPSRGQVSLGNGRYAGSSGVVGSSQGIMGDHNYKGYTNNITDIWCRVYVWCSADYVWGAQKVFTLNNVNAGVGGIGIGGIGAPFEDGELLGCGVYDCNELPPQDPDARYYYHANIDTPLKLGGARVGRWTFVEWRCRMNTQGAGDTRIKDGIFSLWMDDCGNGVRPVNPGGSPTLRTHWTNIMWQGPQNWGPARYHRSLWLENWSNPQSTGEFRWYMLRVRDTGPIGFAVDP